VPCVRSAGSRWQQLVLRQRPDLIQRLCHGSRHRLRPQLRPRLLKSRVQHHVPLRQRAPRHMPIRPRRHLRIGVSQGFLDILES
jgi:hypothetical protein